MSAQHFKIQESVPINRVKLNLKFLDFFIGGLKLNESFINLHEFTKF